MSLAKRLSTTPIRGVFSGAVAIVRTDADMMINRRFNALWDLRLVSDLK
jgi:hypothetical protein